MTTSLNDEVLELFEVNENTKFSISTLRQLLPDMETSLFFAKVYDLDYSQLGQLLSYLFESTVLNALLKGDHSEQLQEYLVETIPDYVLEGVAVPAAQSGAGQIPSEFLVQLFDQARIEVAKSIKDVAAKITQVISTLPSKQGRMVFQHMNVLNRQRPVVGDYKARIKHQHVPDELVILDVSGSMSETTVRAIIDDVVALSWDANAHLAIVSNTARLWTPGTFTVDSVLAAAEYGGTQYEQLIPLFNRNWGSVICIADYDSSYDVKQHFVTCTGRIGQVFDISLVRRPTFLAECVGQLADKVTPLLVAQRSLCH